MRGCTRLNSFAAPSGRSSVQGLLRIRLTRSSHANVMLSTALATTPFTDATAISTHRFVCASKKCLSLSDRAVHLEAYAGITAVKDLVAPMRVIADILVIVGAETLWIDVSVVDLGCHQYIEWYRSIEVLDAAAKAMETTKRNHYSAKKTPSHCHPHLSSPSCSKPQED